MLEVTVLCGLRNLTLGCAVLAVRPAYARLSALASLFLVTAATAVGGEAGIAVLAPLAGFAVVGIVWLILVYWQRLQHCVRPPTHHAAACLFRRGLGLSDAGSGRSRRGGWAVSRRHDAQRIHADLGRSGRRTMPTPARAWVTATTRSPPASDPKCGRGSPRARSTSRPTGPASTTPSTSTTASRSSPSKRERMIALGQQGMAEEQRERPAENLQAGREFSAVRQKPDRRERCRPSDREAKALALRQGADAAAPRRWLLYDRFDGRDMGRGADAAADRLPAWSSRTRKRVDSVSTGPSAPLFAGVGRRTRSRSGRSIRVRCRSPLT